MPEWKLSDERKKEYEGFLKAAQENELIIGSMQYRMSKILKGRADIDLAVKQWWEKLSDELKLDKSKDYMMNADGMVREVPRTGRPPQPSNVIVPPTKAPESKVGTNASTLK